LCRLPAAQQLSSDQVMQLLVEAAQNRIHLGVQKLCLLPAAQEFGSNQVIHLLEGALQRGCRAGRAAAGLCSCIRELCNLPAAQQLSSEQVMQLLATAVQHSHSSRTRGLCMLPAAQQLDADQVMQIATTAKGRHTIAHCAELSRLPAVQQLGKEQKLQVLTAARATWYAAQFERCDSCCLRGAVQCCWQTNGSSLSSCCHQQQHLFIAPATCCLSFCAGCQLCNKQLIAPWYRFTPVFRPAWPAWQVYTCTCYMYTLHMLHVQCLMQYF
jgi:hypothetical protein